LEKVWALFDVGEKERQKETLLWEVVGRLVGGVQINDSVPLSFHTDRRLRKEAVGLIEKR
jgi:hypothetical protein